MRITQILVLLGPLLLALLADTAAAEETDFASLLLTNKSLLSSRPESCDTKTASLNNFDLQRCSAFAFRDADREMNDAYNKAIATGSKARNDRLKAAQRHWLAFRNLECDWESLEYEGGTLAPVAMGNCLVAVTRDRVRALNEAQSP